MNQFQDPRYNIVKLGLLEQWDDPYEQLFYLTQIPWIQNMSMGEGGVALLQLGYLLNDVTRRTIQEMNFEFPPLKFCQKFNQTNTGAVHEVFKTWKQLAFMVEKMLQTRENAKHGALTVLESSNNELELPVERHDTLLDEVFFVDTIDRRVRGSVVLPWYMSNPLVDLMPKFDVTYKQSTIEMVDVATVAVAANPMADLLGSLEIPYLALALDMLFTIPTKYKYTLSHREKSYLDPNPNFILGMCLEIRYEGWQVIFVKQDKTPRVSLLNTLCAMKAMSRWAKQVPRWLSVDIFHLWSFKDKNSFEATHLPSVHRAVLSRFGPLGPISFFSLGFENSFRKFQLLKQITAPPPQITEEPEPEPEFESDIELF